MGSYIVRARVMSNGMIRSQSLERVNAGVLAGFLRGLADAVERGDGEIAMLSVERSSDPALPGMPEMSITEAEPA